MTTDDDQPPALPPPPSVEPPVEPYDHDKAFRERHRDMDLTRVLEMAHTQDYFVRVVDAIHEVIRGERSDKAEILAELKRVTEGTSANGDLLGKLAVAQAKTTDAVAETTEAVGHLSAEQSATTRAIAELNTQISELRRADVALGAGLAATRESLEGRVSAHDLKLARLAGDVAKLKRPKPKTTKRSKRSTKRR